MHRHLPLNTSRCFSFVCFAYLLPNFIHLVWLLLAGRHKESECEVMMPGNYIRNRILFTTNTNELEYFICYRGSPTAASCPKAEVVSVLPHQTDIDAPSSAGLAETLKARTQTRRMHATHSSHTNTRGMHSVAWQNSDGMLAGWRAVAAQRLAVGEHGHMVICPVSPINPSWCVASNRSWSRIHPNHLPRLLPGYC